MFSSPWFLVSATVPEHTKAMATSDPWPRLFTWADYLLFALTLLVSSLVGVYHAWRGASASTSEYLMGGKKMPIFPVAMSLAARYCCCLHVPTFKYLLPIDPHVLGTEADYLMLLFRSFITVYFRRQHYLVVLPTSTWMAQCTCSSFPPWLYARRSPVTFTYLFFID